MVDLGDTASTSPPKSLISAMQQWMPVSASTLAAALVRLFGGEDAKVLVVLKIGAVKAIQACHLGAGDFVKHAALAKDAAHAGGQSGVQHLGLAAQHNGHLHLVDVVHANAGGVVGAGKAERNFARREIFTDSLGMMSFWHRETIFSLM